MGAGYVLHQMPALDVGIRETVSVFHGIMDQQAFLAVEVAGSGVAAGGIGIMVCLNHTAILG